VFRNKTKKKGRRKADRKEWRKEGRKGKRAIVKGNKEGKWRKVRKKRK
jgi:hypothetical protein